MKMFPSDVDFSEIKIATVDENKGETVVKSVGRSFLFDFNNKQFVLLDGAIQECTHTEAICQWIKLYINTEMGKYKIYSDDYGVNTAGLIGYRLPRSFIVSEIKRRISEGIIKFCPLVEEVTDWNFDKGTFEFKVKTTLGEELTITDVI